MPVRIYDIAKKLGIENKDVLAKAKELGITAARVPSSSLDKITAEYLESHLRPAAPVAAEPPSPPPAPEPVLIVSAPPEPALETLPPPTAPEPAADEVLAISQSPVQLPAPPEVAAAAAPAAPASPVEPPPPTPPPPPPAPPPGPRIGE